MTRVLAEELIATLPAGLSGLFNPWRDACNRTPTDAELAHGVDALKLLANAFPKAKIVAVGQKAVGVLGMLGVPFHAAVRHPANGGATAFSEGLAAAVGAQ